MDTPEYLKSTVALIQRSFPDQLDEEQYFALLALLYDHMCDESLALTMHIITGRDPAAITNDIWGAGQRTVPDNILSDTQSRLDQAGFSAWLEEN